MSEEQLRSILLSAGISKEMLSSSAQSTLATLVKTISLLEMHHSLMSPQAALAELLKVHSDQAVLINQEIKVLEGAQDALRSSTALLSDVRILKASLDSREKGEIAENITYNLEPKKQKLTKAAIK